MERRCRAVARGVFAATAVLVGASACGLVLGIDDIPNVVGSVDGGHRDATHRDGLAKETSVALDAGSDGDAPGSDAPEDAVSDAMNRGDGLVDASPDVALAREATAESGGRDGDPEASGPPGELPQPTGPETTSDAGLTIAMHHMWLGETDPTTAFTFDQNAWASFGYNIDGKVTTATSTDVCTRASGASASVQTDGNQGIDNSFGENVVQILNVAYHGISPYVTNRIEAGYFTLLIDTVGLSSSPTQSNVGLTSSLFGGGRFQGTPTFTLADNWPVDPTSLADGVTIANGAKVTFSDSYVTGGTWVSGHPTDVSFILALSTRPLVLTLHQGVMTFQHTVDSHGVNHAVHGSIAGILKASEFIASVRAVAGGVDDGGDCNLLVQFDEVIKNAQDILLDGTNEQGEACDGISIAIAFDGDQIQAPSTVSPPMTFDGAPPGCPADAN